MKSLLSCLPVAAGLIGPGTVIAQTASLTTSSFAPGVPQTSSANYTIPDNFGPVDGDGLDDEWQFQFFDEDSNGSLDPTEAANAAPDGDPDMDQQDNTFELLAGYDPSDPHSFFTFTIAGRTGTTATLRLSKVIAGTRYRIQKSSDLGQADPFATFTTLLPGSGQLDQEVNDLSATGPESFYQVLLDGAP